MYSASLANICIERERERERQTFCHHQEWEEEVLANLANASFWHTTTSTLVSSASETSRATFISVT